MKVKYIQPYTDEFNDTYEPHWVAEHTDAEGARRVALGVCIEVNPDTKTFKYKADAQMIIEECATPADASPNPFENNQPLTVASKSKK